MLLHNPVVLTLFVCVLIQLIAWFHQWCNNNADVVDIGWSACLIIGSVVYFFMAPAEGIAVYLLWLFPCLWYSRLLLHLLMRYQPAHEDSRYKNLREYWQKNTQNKFFFFFLFQAFLGWLFALPAYFISHSEQGFEWNIFLALFIGLVAFIGVTTADYQLYRFKLKPNNKNKVCQSGLWAYSRHPNYFFEWLHWFVYPLLAWQTGYFYWACLYPFLMLVFLLKLTGIPFSEQQALKNRGEAYLLYQNKTNRFFLWKRKNVEKTH